MDPTDIEFIVVDEKGEETDRKFTMNLTSIPTPGNCFNWNEEYMEVQKTKLEGDNITVYVEPIKKRGKQ